MSRGTYIVIALMAIAFGIAAIHNGIMKWQDEKDMLYNMREKWYESEVGIR